jgi:DUF4097 and DUF4098 domain-containing protein YvlB
MELAVDLIRIDPLGPQSQFQRENAMNRGMTTLVLIVTGAVALGTASAGATESTFEKTLSVDGTVTLHVSTGSGNIHISPGTDNQVHIFGRVKSGWNGGNEDRVRDIAAHPPIEQTGSIIHIGSHMENVHNISIDYEIKAPAKTILEASSGSGNVDDDGVGVNARLNTGSGNIHAKGLSESFSVETGSGNIFAEQTGSGDVKANTGSGNIELRNVSGGLKAQTGSGDIKVGGRLETGSGSVELWSNSTPLTLEASTGSGTIHVEGNDMDTSHSDKHNLSAKVHGGGPTVRVETGSGDIRVH